MRRGRVGQVGLPTVSEFRTWLHKSILDKDFDAAQRYVGDSLLAVAGTLRGVTTVVHRAVCGARGGPLVSGTDGIEATEQWGTAQPVGYPELSLAAVVRRVDAVPSGNGNFETQVTVQTPPAAKLIVPGMHCQIRLAAYHRPAAVTVPPAAVVPGTGEDTGSYVYVVGEGDAPAKRAVTVGKKTDDQVEILRGLKAGERVLLERPEE